MLVCQLHASEHNVTTLLFVPTICHVCVNQFPYFPQALNSNNITSHSFVTSFVFQYYIPLLKLHTTKSTGLTEDQEAKPQYVAGMI